MLVYLTGVEWSRPQFRHVQGCTCSLKCFGQDVYYLTSGVRDFGHALDRWAAKAPPSSIVFQAIYTSVF